MQANVSVVRCVRVDQEDVPPPFGGLGTPLLQRRRPANKGGKARQGQASPGGDAVGLVLMGRRNSRWGEVSGM